mmetsp:Transcript_21163/g.31802  ORF Transcript_21163/g.31802 Transcript_21163/m.31802 type:complete len:444 (-) Transcript_21163:100-1431(-)
MTSIVPIDVILEESTINPRSPLPSFLEMKLLEATLESARKVLKSSIEAIATHASQHSQRSSSSRRLSTNDPRSSLSRCISDKISLLILKICRAYSLELEMLITYIIERKFLVSGHCAISEQIFGFKRSNIISEGNRLKPLRQHDTIKTALLLAIGPYINEKLKRWYEMERERDRHVDAQNNNAMNDHTHPSQNRMSQQFGTLYEKLRSCFTYLYPFLHLSNEGIHFAYNFAYMIGKSVYYNPSLHILGQIVRRLTMADMEQKPINEKNSSAKPKSTLKLLRGPALSGLALAFCLGWIGQFRQELRRRRRRLVAREDSIINNSTRRNMGRQHHVGTVERGVSISNVNSSSNGNSNIPIIPPPLPPALHLQDGIGRIPTNPSLCPLCNQERVNPVASTSGFVFCYKCMALYIRENGEKCPITGMRCKESELTRIYESTSVANRSP